MEEYHRKLYALLNDHAEAICKQLECLSEEDSQQLQEWWEKQGKLLQDIASSSDRVNLHPNSETNTDKITIKHPISGQEQSVSTFSQISELGEISKEKDLKKVFWWFWRFYPEIVTNQPSNTLLIPAHKILPDCPQHSYNSTVSALAGAIPEDWEAGQPDKHPYLILFTFSPVQEFIKASRKFLDFWSSSYLLHYFGAKLCWKIAQEYGPDAVITPSLWSQEIIDALIVKEYPDFAAYFERFQEDKNPVSRFKEKQSTSLSTAGFPNVITALVPGKKQAEELCKKLSEQLREEWKEIADKVREKIKEQVIKFLNNSNITDQILQEFPSADHSACKRDLEQWKQHGCWEWNKLWDAQISNTWETYWTAVPLGHPGQALEIEKSSGKFNNWKISQEAIAPSRQNQTIPTQAEEKVYNSLNIGTWWGNGQARLGKLIQSVKNTRTWQIATAPGERSTLSGQFSAVHPRIHYDNNFREGAGVSAGSMRLFWLVMAEAFPGLFNGSEKLNALELTKRMAWVYGGVAEKLGIEITTNSEEMDYEGFIRFPNLSSIAAARFAHDHPEKVQEYWKTLQGLINNAKDASGEKVFSREERDKFHAKTRRPFHVPKTDPAIEDNYNGVMFSSKWLADDMSLNQSQGKVNKLRELVEQAHKNVGFGEGSPADWWVIVLADGDGMGKYVSGAKLHKYEGYIIDELVDKTKIDDEIWKNFIATKKRMGPATHVGLNRALLDFSNRLVPHITEKRFCGKVVYSGGDDVMAVLPLEDLPEYLRALRAAWCGGEDPQNEFSSEGGYWHPKSKIEGIAARPHFTMGENATMSMGIVIAHKSVPLPTVLENLWSAEKERAKKIPGKDGLCFRVIYGGGNILEAVMKGHLLESWYSLIKSPVEELSPLLYRLAEELPRRATWTENHQLFSEAAKVIIQRRDESKKLDNSDSIMTWLNAWENWVKSLNTDKKTWEEWVKTLESKKPLGTQPEDLGKILRFSAFWVDKMVQRTTWF